MTVAAWVVLIAWGFGENLKLFIVLYKAYAWNKRIDHDVYMFCLRFVVTLWSGLVILLFIEFLPKTSISQYNRSLCYQSSILKNKQKKPQTKNKQPKKAFTQHRNRSCNSCNLLATDQILPFWSWWEFAVGVSGMEKEGWKRPNPVRCWNPYMSEGNLWACLWVTSMQQTVRLVRVSVSSGCATQDTGVMLATKIHMPVFQQRALYSGRGFNSLSLFLVTWLSVTLHGQSFFGILVFSN